MRAAAFCIMVASTVLAAASVSAAQDRPLARRHFDEGTSQFEAGNYLLALEAFQRVHTVMQGDARAQILVLYNIGRCQQELLRYDDALASFQRYLDEAPSDAPYREQTLDRVRDLRGRVSSQRGRSGGTSNGSLSALGIVGVAVLALGGASAIAAVPTGIAALDAEAGVAATCNGTACPPSSASSIEDARTMADVTDVLWVAGLSLAAAGATLLVVGLTLDEGAPTVSAMCTPTGCTASFRARF